MAKDQKLDALKDLSVNPFMLNDGYDALTNALYRWKTIATSPEATKASPQEREQAAENYYKSTLEPIYTQMLHAKPVDPEIWKKEAYDRALQWNMDEAYDSHWRSGLYEGFKDYENIFLAGLHGLAGIVRSEAAAYGQLHGLHTEKKDIPVMEIPILGSTIRSLQRAKDHDVFWHDINPDLTWQEKARSFVLEQAMMLPLYRATGGFNEGLIGGLTGEAKVPLTQLLAKSNLGSTVTKMLLNGGEGAAYGYTMVDPSERKDAWKWGVQQAILGTLFSSAGKSFRLKDVVKPEDATALEEGEIEANLGTKGFVKNDVEGLREEAAQALSGISAAGGRPAVLQVIKSALGHLKDTESLSEEDIRNGIQANMDVDKPRWKSTYITSAYLRALLQEQGKKFSEFKPADIAKLRKTLIDLVQRGEEGMPKFVAEGKGDKAAVVAAEKVSRKPVEQALDIAERKGKAVKINGDPGRLRIRTKYGKDAVSYSANMEWIADAKARVEAAGLKWTSSDISKWLNKDGGISHEDFVDDLREFFYPKALKEIDPELKWEYRNEETGKEHPNFLAFMYNYADQMPKQFAERLSQELENTEKYEQWFNPKEDTEKQKIHYAKGMYAHIQELLASDRYKKPNALGQIGNVYQTTYENIKDPTLYQMELHKETVEAETALLEGMFRGKKNAEALKHAMSIYSALADARFQAFKEGKQELRIAKQAEIDKLIVEKSKGKRVPLEF